VTTDAIGLVNPPTAFILPAATVPGEWITATATDSAGDTSEFSAAWQLRAPAPPVIVTSTSGTSTYGQSLNFSVIVAPSSSGFPTPTGNVQFQVDGVNLGSAVTLVNGGATSINTTALTAGAHSITAVYSGDSIYPPSFGSFFQTVKPAPLAVTADNESKTYGQTFTFAGTEFTTGTLYNGDTVFRVTLTSPGAAATATVAGSPYTITPSAAVGPGLGNYTITYGNGSLTVNPAGLTVTADNESKTYGRAFAFAGTEFTTGTLFNGDTVTSVSLSSPGAAAPATVAGSPYPITPSAAIGTGLGNYTITYVNGGLAVAPAALMITADNSAKTYGQAFTFAGTEFTTGALFNGDTVTSVSLSSPGASAPATVAGSPYLIKPRAAVGTGLGNYSITYVDGDLVVNPASLSVTAGNQIETYGASLPGLTYTYSGLVDGDIGSVFSGALSTTATASSNVGSYAINQGTLSAGANYTISYAGGTLTVIPAPLTITANAKSKTYGSALPSFDASYSGLVNGDSSSVVSGLIFSTIATASSNVGTYAITPSGASATNYSISYAGGTLTVNPALLTITANGKSKTYGAALPSFDASYSGLVNGDSSSVVSGLTFTTIATASSNVGTYAITPSGASATNYSISYAGGTLTVNPAPLSVTAGNQSKTYGAALPELTYTYSGLVDGDTGSVFSGALSTTATASSSVGGYAINEGILSAGGNYTFSYAGGTVTVNPAALTITANGKSKTYGAAQPSFDASYSGLVNGDSSAVVSGLTFSTPATASSNVGTYAITPSGASASNYSISYAGGTLTVNPAPLTISADDEVRGFGQPNPPLAVSYSGFVNGDGSSSLTTPAVASTSASSSSAAGVYPITVGGATSPNYTISYQGGTLTVAAAPPLVTMTSVQRVLNKKRQVTQILVTFSNQVNAAEAQQVAIYRLATAGKHGSYTAKNARIIKLRSAVYSASADTVTLTPKTPFTLSKPVQLQVNGQPPSGLQDALGRFINGGTDDLALLTKKTVTISALVPNPSGLGQVITPAAVDLLLEQGSSLFSEGA